MRIDIVSNHDEPFIYTPNIYIYTNNGVLDTKHSILKNKRWKSVKVKHKIIFVNIIFYLLCLV